jgi:hypothetical protein
MEKLGSDVKHSRRIDATRDPTAVENHMRDASVSRHNFSVLHELLASICLGSLVSEATAKGKEEAEPQQTRGTSTSTASNYL